MYELSYTFAADFDINALDEKMIDEWIQTADEISIAKLRFCLMYLSKKEPSKAYMAAKKMVYSGKGEIPLNEALRVLLNSKSNETENIMVDYMITHSNSDEYWETVSTYWD